MPVMYYQSTCAKCDEDMLVPVRHVNDDDYYLCHACAHSKAGV